MPLSKSQTPTHYRVVPLDLKAHLYRVRCELESTDPEGQVFAMPCWVRGSYRIRDFPKHVVTLSAYSGEKQVTIEHLDKGRLRCAPCAGSLILDYTVYALDASVRMAWLDCKRGFFNGSALFYAPDLVREQSFHLTLERPRDETTDEWRVFTAMSPLLVDEKGFGTYFASDFEALIDHPVEIGPHQEINFQVDDIPHSLVLSGRCTVDMTRLANDLTAICSVQRRLFECRPLKSDGLERYLFLCNVRAKGLGGLEHRSSSALTCNRDALPRPGESDFKSSYYSFLGLAGHEYFHLWNGKRITPARLAKSDLSAEVYTRDLWAVEGITSYYGDLMLLRAGLINIPAYLDLVARVATRVEREPGHRVQSLSDCSFEAWIKHYQPDANTANASTNYYSKGALVALCLDLTLRLHSEVSLDDVMRHLWRLYGMTGKGASEGALEKAAADRSGLDLTTFFDHALRSTDPLPLAELLDSFGVATELRSPPVCLNDTTVDQKQLCVSKKIELGIHIERSDGSVKNVRRGSAGELAGLEVGDIPVALDGWRLRPENWDALVESLTVGQHYRMHYFRDEELFEAIIEPAPAVADAWLFSLADADAESLARRKQWLGV